MGKDRSLVHPYIPNSVPEIKAEMLEAIGMREIEELYHVIPDRLRLQRKLDLPRPHLAEVELKRYIKDILMKNGTCEENLSFLGGGCWQHYIPAICDEIVNRSEVLTAYAGEEYSDLGKLQMIFEYQSQLGELVGMDVVSVPTYSWGFAAGSAIRMASRINGRNEVLLPKTIGGERLCTIQTLCGPDVMPGHIDVSTVTYDVKTGLLDLEDLKGKISSKTAAVYLENPSYLGFMESQVEEIGAIAHGFGAEFIVGVDPISLGVLSSPSEYGADIVVGTIQPLGVHMNCGGGECAFIASRDEHRYVAEYPTMMVSITRNVMENEYGFGWCTWGRTGYSCRDELGQIRNESKDFIGTVSTLWAIAAAVYMTVMGPQGFKEIGELIIQKSHYAMELLSKIPGVRLHFSSNCFKEFVVNFDDTSKSVKEINNDLLKYNIFGGKDISEEFPELGNSALYCITEIHTAEDINKLANCMREVLAQ